ncbi:hypothetical protein DERF_009689 [Dermatophagoides farinae]|uniref:Uncharacterized protein n=1 Tax=Dermatophagoides farinae TaxID=6954 RepID=A0A922HWW9_DERFA|nr:hypothetical protein DERF_009689 [Dermatophagoides farinae]
MKFSLCLFIIVSALMEFVLSAPNPLLIRQSLLDPATAMAAFTPTINSAQSFPTSLFSLYKNGLFGLNFPLISLITAGTAAAPVFSLPPPLPLTTTTTTAAEATTLPVDPTLLPEALSAVGSLIESLTGNISPVDPSTPATSPAADQSTTGELPDFNFLQILNNLLQLYKTFQNYF